MASFKVKMHRIRVYRYISMYGRPLLFPGHFIHGKRKLKSPGIKQGHPFLGKSSSGFSSSAAQ